METFGTGERKGKGDHLIECAEEHKLIIANTLFQKPRPDTGLEKRQMEKQEIR